MKPLGLALLIVALLGLPASGQPLDGDPATLERVEAATPVASAVAVSQLRFPTDGSTASAVLATSRDFADALTGASLFPPGGAAGSAPLLLTAPESLDPAVAGELQRVLPAGAEVLVLGGVNALSAQVTTDLEALGFAPRRLEGPTRFETAGAIAEEFAAGNPVNSYVVVRGDAPAENPTAAWADALSASTMRQPILLTQTAQLHPVARRLIDELATQPGQTGVVVLGGLGALSQQVEDDLAVAGVRLAGPTRDGTAAEVARYLGITPDSDPRSLVLYNGFSDDGWAYGLPAATVARDVGAALMPVNTGGVATATARLVSCGPAMADLLAIGDESVVPEATIEALRDCPDDAAGIVLDGVEVTPGATIGGPVQPAIDAVIAVLGAPTEDSGWVVGCPFDSDAANERSVQFGDFGLNFYEEAGTQFLRSWFYGPPSDLDLRTARGIGNGATNADVGAAYPETELVVDDVFGPMWEIPESAGGPMTLIPSDSDPASPIITMYGGAVLYCD